MQITTNSIVLKQHAAGENRFLTLLTDKLGVITAYARSAKGFTGKLSNSTELLCYSCFVVFKNKEQFVVDKADVNRIFFGIRQNIEKLALASYFSELMVECAAKEEKCPKHLQLMLNTLHVLENSPIDLMLLKSVFELRTLSISGYMPNLLACRDCAVFEADYMYFSPCDGKIVCGECIHNHSGEWISVPKGVLYALRHIIFSDKNKLFAFSLPSPAILLLSEITDKYRAYHLEYHFKTLDFYLLTRSQNQEP